MSQTPSEPLEVDLGNGILSFDGRIVEFFGFQNPESRRIHISEVVEVKLSDGRLSGGTVTVDGRGTSMIVAFAKPEDHRLPEVEQFMQAVRDAAPNLKERQ